MLGQIDSISDPRNRAVFPLNQWGFGGEDCIEIRGGGRKYAGMGGQEIAGHGPGCFGDGPHGAGIAG